VQPISVVAVAAEVAQTVEVAAPSTLVCQIAVFL